MPEPISEFCTSRQPPPTPLRKLAPFSLVQPQPLYQVHPHAIFAHNAPIKTAKITFEFKKYQK